MGGGRGLQAKIFANHVAAYLFPYNLICSFGVGEGGGGGGRGQQSKYLLPMLLHT